MIFLFNPGRVALPAMTASARKGIGLTAGADFVLSQEHPAGGAMIRATGGARTVWNVPARSAAVIRIERAA